jgi:SAM-dependent methyltransferase
MAHAEQDVFFKTLKASIPGFFVNRSVLEVGSCDVNGSIRHYFEDCEYWGIDLVAGPGVDEVVSSGHEYSPRHRTSFDVTVSTECFEHNPYYVATLQNMIELTAPGGIVVFTCASRGRPEHGTLRTTPHASPGTIARGWSYYRNLTEKDFARRMTLKDFFSSYRFFYNPRSCDLYFVAMKLGEQRAEPSCSIARLEQAYRSIEASILESNRRGSLGRLHRLDLLLSRVLVSDFLFQTVWGATSRRVLEQLRRRIGNAPSQ